MEPLAGLRLAESGSETVSIRGAVPRLSPSTARLDEAELRERVRHPGDSTASASDAGEAPRARTHAGATEGLLGRLRTEGRRGLPGDAHWHG